MKNAISLLAIVLSLTHGLACAEYVSCESMFDSQMDNLNRQASSVYAPDMTLQIARARRDLERCQANTSRRLNQQSAPSKPSAESLAAAAKERHDKYVRDFESVRTLQDIEDFKTSYAGINDPDGLIPKLEPLEKRLLAERDQRKAVADEAWHAQYVSDFESVNTLDGVDNFKRRYGSSDPDGLIPKLDLLAKKITHEQYVHEFENVTSLERIDYLEKRYGSDDPDGLIPKLAPLKKQLQYAEYRNRFKAAKTSAELQSCITDYSQNDPDKLIPQAKKRLATALKSEQVEQARLNRVAIAEQERLSQVAAAEQKQKELDRLASNIAYCNSQMSAAYRALERERRVASVSGYENKLIMRQAGEIIVGCGESNAQNYEAYRKLGGKRSLADLK